MSIAAGLLIYSVKERKKGKNIKSDDYFTLLCSIIDSDRKVQMSSPP